MEFMSSQTLAAYYGGNNVFTGFVLAPNGSAYMYFDGTPIPDPYFTLLYSQVSGAYPLIAINNNLRESKDARTRAFSLCEDSASS